MRRPRLKAFKWPKTEVKVHRDVWSGRGRCVFCELLGFVASLSWLIVVMAAMAKPGLEDLPLEARKARKRQDFEAFSDVSSTFFIIFIVFVGCPRPLTPFRPEVWLRLLRWHATRRASRRKRSKTDMKTAIYAMKRHRSTHAKAKGTHTHIYRNI